MSALWVARFRVVDERGPVAGAQITGRVREARKGAPTAARALAASTDASGAAELAVPWLDGSAVLVQATDAGRASPLVWVLPSSDSTTLRLAPTGALEVHLVGADGQPAVGNSVQLFACGEQRAEGRCDGSGAVILEGLAAGSYRLSTWCPDDVEPRRESIVHRTVEIAAGRTRVLPVVLRRLLDVSFYVDAPADFEEPPRLLLSPIDSADEPFHCRVRDGVASRELPEGRWRASFVNVDQPSEEIAVGPDQTEFGLRVQGSLRPRGEFEGRVLGPDGVPVADAEIVTGRPSFLPSLISLAKTDANGRFRFEDRRRSVQVHARKSRLGTSAPAEVRAGDPAILRLSPPTPERDEDAAQLQIYVHEAGVGAAGAEVVLRDRDLRWTAVSGSDGVASFRLPRARLEEIWEEAALLAHAVRGALRSAVVSVAPVDRGAILGLTLPATLTVRLRTPRGAAVEGAEVSLRFLERSQKSDADGVVTFDGVAAGPVRVLIAAEGYDVPPFGRDLWVEAGSRQTIEIELSPLIPIVARVRTRSGLVPRLLNYVVARQPGVEGFSMVKVSDGEAHIALRTEGRWDLHVRDAPEAAATVVVPGQSEVELIIPDEAQA